MTVRATGIADASPALSAGRSRFSDQLPGTLPFAIQRSFWEKKNEDEGHEDEADENVVPTDEEAIIRVTEGTIELYNPRRDHWNPIGIVIQPAGESELRSLGDQVIAQVPPRIDQYIRAVVDNQPGQRGYVVVIGDSGLVAGRVIGFGYVDQIGYDLTDPDPANPGRFVMTKRTGRIAAQNASAVPVRAVDPDIASNLIQENRRLEDVLLVPINRPTYGRRRE
jgi:hypothetical protein